VNAAVTAAIKRGLLTTGYYRRALGRSRFPGVVVLGYHGLRGDGWPDGSMAFENLHVRASTFAAHCRVIRDTCDPISLDDWRAAIAGTAPLPPRPVLVTFDDGYRSVFTIGAPMLAEHGLPAVVFACSDPMARRALLWFDAVAARDGEGAVEPWKGRDYRQWRAACARSTQTVSDTDARALMTSEELGNLSRQPGIEIGGHTARHPILALEAWTGRPVRAFAYPNGRPGVDYGRETVTILHDLGFDFGFTMRPGFATAGEPPLERSRFMVVAEVLAAELAHRLAYAWPR
jgi:peptidoglycan/xylan/chitin deacetylase (PgdA/CDA1 family)